MELGNLPPVQQRDSLFTPFDKDTELLPQGEQLKEKKGQVEKIKMDDEEGVMFYRPRSKPIHAQENDIPVEELLLRTRAGNREVHVHVCSEQPTLGTFSGDKASSGSMAAADLQQDTPLAGGHEQVTPIADQCERTSREEGEKEKEEEKEDIADQYSEGVDQGVEVTKATKQLV